MSTIKYNPNVVKAGNAAAKGLEEDGAQSKAELTRAKATLTTLQHTKGKTSGEKAALTKVINRLSEAIQDASLPGRGGHGPNGPGGGRDIIKVRADDPLPGGRPDIIKVRADDPLPGGRPDIIKVRADDPLPGRGGHGPNGPQRPDMIKIRADDPLPGEGGIPGNKLSPAMQSKLKGLADDAMDNANFKRGGFIESQPIGSQRWESLKVRDNRPADGHLVTVFVRAGQLNRPGDPNQAKEFFVERESLRGGKSWAGPFPIEGDRPGAPKLSKETEAALKKAAGKLNDINWKGGGFIQSQPIGSQRWENVTLRDDRPRDGAKITAFVRAGQLNAPGDPNKAKEYYLEMESLRGGKSWAGPFPLKKASGE